MGAKNGGREVSVCIEHVDTHLLTQATKRVHCAAPTMEHCSAAAASLASAENGTPRFEAFVAGDRIAQRHQNHHRRRAQRRPKRKP
jgi:hypothetical protein